VLFGRDPLHGVGAAGRDSAAIALLALAQKPAGGGFGRGIDPGFLSEK
jgi:hypothetical protein